MRISFAIIAIAFAATPALAAPPPQPNRIQIPPELSDPAFIDRIGQMTGALSKALLDLPIGEVEAAAEGRPAAEADRSRRVRDVAGVSAEQLQREVAETRPQMEAATRAFVRQLPAITRALSQAAEEMDRVVANMPPPDYPRR